MHLSGLIVHSALLPVEYSIIKLPDYYENLNVLIIHGSEDNTLTTKWALQGKMLFKNWVRIQNILKLI